MKDHVEQCELILSIPTMDCSCVNPSTRMQAKAERSEEETHARSTQHRPPRRAQLIETCRGSVPRENAACAGDRNAPGSAAGDAHEERRLAQQCCLLSSSTRTSRAYVMSAAHRNMQGQCAPRECSTACLMRRLTSCARNAKMSQPSITAPAWATRDES